MRIRRRRTATIHEPSRTPTQGLSVRLVTEDEVQEEGDDEEEEGDKT